MANSKIAFICGSPVEHSRSPIIHNYWLKQNDLAGKYIKRLEIPEEFPSFLNSLVHGPMLGGNITIPHKETAFELIENVDPVAKRLGAVNTVWVKNKTLYGANTDGYGFLANLDQLAPGWDNPDRKSKTVIILGAGGAARAIIDAVKSRGFANIKVINRTLERAQKLANFFGEPITAHQWQDLPNLMQTTNLLINTTSLGMSGKPSLEIDLNPLPEDCLVNDIVYVPLQTRLLIQAKKRGLKTVDGLGMLLHQAVPGFERWFGIKPVVSDELRQLLISDLEQSS